MNKKYNLQKIIDEPIEFAEMQRILAYYHKNESLKLVLGRDLVNKTCNEIFSDEYAPFVVYFIQNKETNIGHYTLLTWISEKEIEFFDPAGTSGQIIEEYHPELYNFAANNDLGITFNTTGLQGKNSNTCSRHCIYRAMLFNVTNLGDFFKFYPKRSVMTPDQFISCLIRYPKM